MDNFPQHVSSYLKTIFRWTKYPFYTGFSTKINDDKSLTYLVDNYFPGNKNTFSGRNNKKLDGTIQTNVSEIKNYCKAEEYHQKYIEKNR